MLLFGQNERVSRHPILAGLLIVYCAWGGWHWYDGRSVHKPDGILAPADPLQGDPLQAAPDPNGDATPHPLLRIGRWTLTPRASYRITARILGVERYRFDSLASLVPEDLALGWGPMSDNRILASLNISQSNRFYYWQSPKSLPLPREEIIAHSANTHVIPESEAIAAQLSHLRPGQVVTLSGTLVDGSRDDGVWIRTSLVRTDTGAGACEVLLVRDLQVEP